MDNAWLVTAFGWNPLSANATTAVTINSAPAMVATTQIAVAAAVAPSTAATGVRTETRVA